ncbi:hypothetical protein [Pseudalkalibacillus berkeleyi]|uniref:Uncharacterized protein n=1 Tax=Pseudalkalibacillus berkeleyi TaxID=1069813 RepID=A0ABS9GXX3_9BACL|nr:hypothetical protein [Pseudalkalibacillus berkeleyi]MCF6136601.1 hypothetical protein [Pseudalkalibacillus berkeleyi]
MIATIFGIVNLLIVIYVIFSLSTIKHQLNLISKQININEEMIQTVSNEEIEKELEEDLKK